MLLTTGLPSLAERTAAVAAIPRVAHLQHVGGVARGALENQAVDFIDAAIGTENHGRAALVALHEGFDYLFQAALEIADSVAADAYFTQNDPFDPFAAEDPPPLLEAPAGARFHLRLARFGIENAAVKVATAGDHFANAHIRLAWEANAALRPELKACGFDPAEAEPAKWASLESLRHGLRSMRKENTFAVFPAFRLNEPFRTLFGSYAVRRARRFRDEVVHRERPTYKEAPGFGRQSLWRSRKISIKYPAPPDHVAGLPSLGDRRSLVVQALDETLTYGEACWDLAVEWLRTIDIWISPDADAKTVRIQTTFGEIAGPSYPREQRDPGPFLLA